MNHALEIVFQDAEGVLFTYAYERAPHRFVLLDSAGADTRMELPCRAPRRACPFCAQPRLDFLEIEQALAGAIYQVDRSGSDPQQLADSLRPPGDPKKQKRWLAEKKSKERTRENVRRPPPRRLR